MAATPFQAAAIRISLKPVILYPEKFANIYHILAESST
jgi:hypothetical protein